jgi:hypothetical protein
MLSSLPCCSFRWLGRKREFFFPEYFSSEVPNLLLFTDFLSVYLGGFLFVRGRVSIGILFALGFEDRVGSFIDIEKHR